MKVLVTYASNTGNTEKIAKSIAEAIPGSICAKLPTSENPQDYDLIFCGFWCDKGHPDDEWKNFYGTIQNVPTAVFGTLGGNPNSERGSKFARQVKEQVNTPFLLDLRLWQGKVDPKIIEIMNKMSGAPMTEERKKRLDEAAKHPDQNDLNQAAQWAKNIVRSLQK